MMKQPRIKNEAHLAFIRMLPCCICGDNTSTEAAHVRTGNLRAGKRPVGLSEKPDDRWTVPLCGADHRDQHDRNEMKFWGTHGIDPHFLALSLWGVTGNVELGEQIVRANAPAFVGV